MRITRYEKMNFHILPPWYYGLSYYDLVMDCAVYYPIPVNLIVRWWRWFVRWWDYWRSNPSEEHTYQALQERCARHEREIERLRGLLDEARSKYARIIREQAQLEYNRGYRDATRAFVEEKERV